MERRKEGKKGKGKKAGRMKIGCNERGEICSVNQRRGGKT